MQLATFHPDFRFADSAGLPGTNATFQPLLGVSEGVHKKPSQNLKLPNINDIHWPISYQIHGWCATSGFPSSSLSTVGFVENHRLAPKAGPNDAADFVGRAPAPAFHLLREKERRGSEVATWAG